MENNTLSNSNNYSDTTFYDSIVKNLKQEAEKLNQKLEKLRDDPNSNGYISTLKSLRETLDLISKYDWKLHYSEHETSRFFDSCDPDFSPFKKISIWEQNSDNQIKNNQVWTIVDTVPIYIDILENENDKKIEVIMYNHKWKVSWINEGTSFKKRAYLIENLIKDKKITIYIDVHGFGKVLYDELFQYKNLDVRKLSSGLMME